MKNSLKRILSAVLCLVMVLGFFTFGKPELTGTEADAISVGVNPTPAIDIAVNIPDNYPGDFEMFREEMTEKLAKQLVAQGVAKTVEEAQTLFRITNTAAVIDTTNLEGWYVYDHYYDQTQYNALGLSAAQQKKQPYRVADNSYPKSGNVVKIQDVFINPDGTSKPVSVVGTTLYRFNQHTYSWTNQQTGAANMVFAGYGTNALWDFMVYPSESDGRRTIDFDLDCGAIDTHTLLGPGFLLNANVTDAASSTTVGNLKGYGVYFQWSGTSATPYIIEFKNYSPTASGTMSGYNTVATGSPITGLGNGVKIHISVVLQKDQVNVYVRRYNNGVLGEAQNVFDGLSTTSTKAVSLPNKYGNGFGPFVNYKSHGCASMTYFTFSDLQMGQSVTAFDALKNVQYYQGANQKYFINLGVGNDANIPDESSKDEAQKYIDGIQRMDTNEIFYLSNIDDGRILYEHGRDGKAPEGHKSLTGECEVITNEDGTETSNCVGNHGTTPGTHVNGQYCQNSDFVTQMAQYIAKNYKDNVPFYHGKIDSTIPLANFYITNVTDPKNVTQLMTVHLQHYYAVRGTDKDKIVVNIADKSLTNTAGDKIVEWNLKVLDGSGQPMAKYGGDKGLTATSVKNVDGTIQPQFKYPSTVVNGGNYTANAPFDGFVLSYNAYDGNGDGKHDDKTDTLNTGRYTLQLQVKDVNGNLSATFQTYLTIFVDNEAPTGVITNTSRNTATVSLVDTGEGILDDGITFEGKNRGSGVYGYMVIHVKKGGTAPTAPTAEDTRWKYLSAPTHEFDIPINLSDYAKGDAIYVYYKDECGNIGELVKGSLVGVKVVDADGNVLDEYLSVGEPEAGHLPNDTPPPPAGSPSDTQFTGWVTDDPKDPGKDKDVTEGDKLGEVGKDDEVVIRPSYSNDVVGFYYHANTPSNAPDPATVNGVTDTEGGKKRPDDAKWREKTPVSDSAAVTYDVPLDSSVRTKTQTQVANPSLVGYTFTGWALTPEGKAIGSAKVTGKVDGTGDNKTITEVENNHVYAQWKINSYKLSFNINGGTSGGYATREVDYNTALKGVIDGLNNTQEPTRTGYTFKGWAYTKAEADKGASAQLISTERMPAANHTLYAVWVKSSSSSAFLYLHFYSNGGDAVNDRVYNSSEVNANTVFDNLTTPIREGYTFDGWYYVGTTNPTATEADGSSKIYPPTDAKFAEGNLIKVGETKIQDKIGSKNSGEYWLIAKWKAADATFYIDYVFNTGYAGTAEEGAVQTGNANDTTLYFYESIDAKTLHATLPSETMLRYYMMVEENYPFVNEANKVFGKGLNALIGLTDEEALKKVEAAEAAAEQGTDTTGELAATALALRTVYELWNSNRSHFTDPSKVGKDGEKVKIPNYTIIPDTITSATGSVYWYDSNNAQNKLNEGNGFMVTPGATIKIYYDRLYNISADIQTVTRTGTTTTTNTGELIGSKDERLNEDIKKRDGYEGDGIIGIISEDAAGNKVSIESSTGKGDAIYSVIDDANPEDEVYMSEVLARFSRSITVTWEPVDDYYVSGIFVDGVSHGYWIKDAEKQGSYTFGDTELVTDSELKDGVGLKANHHIVVVFKQGKAPTEDSKINIKATFEGNYDNTCYFWVTDPDSTDGSDSEATITPQASVNSNIAYNSGLNINWKLGDGYALEDVIVDGFSMGAKTNVTNDNTVDQMVDRTSYGFHNVKNDHEVVVKVKKLPINGNTTTTGFYTITVNRYGGDDKVTVSPTTTVRAGDTYRVSWDAYPSEYDIYRVLVDGKEVEVGGSFNNDGLTVLDIQKAYHDFISVDRNHVVDVYLMEIGASPDEVPSYDHYVRLTAEIQGGPGTVSGANLFKSYQVQGTDKDGKPTYTSRTDAATIRWTLGDKEITVNGTNGQPAEKYTESYMVDSIKYTTDGGKTWVTVTNSANTKYDAKGNGSYTFANGLTADTHVVITLKPVTRDVKIITHGPGTASGSKTLWRERSYFNINGSANTGAGISKITVYDEVSHVETIVYSVDPADKVVTFSAVSPFAIAPLALDPGDDTASEDHNKLDKVTKPADANDTQEFSFDLLSITNNQTINVYYVTQTTDDAGNKFTPPYDVNQKEYLISGDTNITGYSMEVWKSVTETEAKEGTSVTLSWAVPTSPAYELVSIEVNGVTYALAKDDDGNLSFNEMKTSEATVNAAFTVQSTVDDRHDDKGTVTVTGITGNVHVIANFELPNNGDRQLSDKEMRESAFDVDAKPAGPVEGKVNGSGSYYKENEEDPKITWDTTYPMGTREEDEDKEGGYKAGDSFVQGAVRNIVVGKTSNRRNWYSPKEFLEAFGPDNKITNDDGTTTDKFTATFVDKDGNEYEYVYDSDSETGKFKKVKNANGTTEGVGEYYKNEDGSDFTLDDLGEWDEGPLYMTGGSYTVKSDDQEDGEVFEFTVYFDNPDDPGRNPKPSGFVPPETTFKVEIENTPNGSTNVSNTEPKAGETVTIYPDPEDGFRTGSVHVYDKDGNEIPVTGPDEDGNYHFIQPESDVLVVVEYVGENEPKYEDVDGDGEPEKVYPGPDGKFGTEDDYYEKDVDGDGEPETIHPGPDGKFGTPDDYYEKDVDGDGEPEKVYPGPDGKFGTDDDTTEPPKDDDEPKKPSNPYEELEPNKDVDGDGNPDVNLDNDGDGIADTDCDFDGDGVPDTNIDTDKDGRPDLNVDTTGDGKPDVNVDTDGDGKPDVNVDTDGDGKPDINIDTDGDGEPDINIDTDGDGIPDKNVISGPNGLNTDDHFAYVIGYTDGKVRPTGNITRAEVATIFFRLLKEEVRNDYWATSNSYSDVADTAWYNIAVSTLANMGILDGYPDGTFRPNNSINRAEFVKIAVSFFEFVDQVPGMPFKDISGHWAENYIKVAAAVNLVNGYTDNTFRPSGAITRAEAMAIVNRVLGRAPHVNGMYPNMITWVDNVKGAWYYADVQEATNSHEYSMDLTFKGKINVYENWTKELPVRDWAALEQQWVKDNTPSVDEDVTPDEEVEDSDEEADAPIEEDVGPVEEDEASDEAEPNPDDDAA